MTPTVVDVTPANNAGNVLRNAEVQVTFSEPMDPATLIGANISVTDGTTEVVGTTRNTATTLIFTPSADLAANTTYTATVTMDVTDVAGTPLAVDYSWQFATGSTPDVSGPSFPRSPTETRRMCQSTPVSLPALAKRWRQQR